MFRRKGIYIALIILSTCVLAANAVFGYTSIDRQSFPANIPAPENNMGQSAEMPAMPEGFAPGQVQPPVAEPVSDFPVLAVSAAAVVIIAFSVIMLCCISRKNRQQNQYEEESGNEDDYPVRKKSQLGSIIVMAAAAAVLIAALFPKGEKDSGGLRAETRVIEETARPGSIEVQLRSGGAIIENNPETVQLAGDIKVEQWLVDSGDYVNEDQPIALVDRDSVILAISELTELMAQLDEDINESFSDVVSNAMYAPASGRVKAVHAQSGVDVRDTVKEHGCLVRLSLDGLMALDTQACEGMNVGMAVAVERADGSFLGGSIEKIADGMATVTLSDEQAAYGEHVKIYDALGNMLGEGSLYIHKEIGITGLAGTVERINVTENMLVGTDMALLVLKNTGFSGERDLLTARRRQMEEELTKLFSAYNSGYIHALCSGRILAVNEEIFVENLFSGEKTFDAVLLSSQSPSMKSYAVSVSAVDSAAGTITVSYTESGSSQTKQISVGTAPVFKYVNSSYQPCTAAEISAGDSLVLGMYVDQSGQESIDHIILYPAQGGGQSGKPDTSQGSGQSNTQGGSQNTSSGGGSKTGAGGSTAASAASGSTAAETEEDPYAYGETILAYITPFDKAEINISIDEADISAYHVGRTLHLSFDALPAQSFTGTVSKIDPNGSNEDGGSTKFSVTVTLDRTEDMLTGMNASLVADIETVQAGIVIPLAAVYEENGEVFVYTAYDAETDTLEQPVSVKTGVSDGEKAEIISGLEPGQKLYYRYADSIEYVR